MVLNRQQMFLFEALYEAHPRVAGHDWLICRVYDYGEYEPNSANKAISVLVFFLRSKLKPLGMRIRNVFGLGYALEID